MMALISAVVTSSETKAFPSVSRRTKRIGPASNFLSRCIALRFASSSRCEKYDFKDSCLRIDSLSPGIRGITYAEARELDGWLRRRVRLYYWKQWGRPRARRRNLLRLVINRETVHLASRSRKGPWRMSQNSKVRIAMSNEWLDQQGVPSIADQWVSIALATARPSGLHFIPAISLRSVRYPDGPKGRLENP